MQVSKLLQYSPTERYTATQALTHSFFDELRNPATLLPNGAPACSPWCIAMPACIGHTRMCPDQFCISWLQPYAVRIRGHRRAKWAEVQLTSAV